eukprot:6419523-Prymnesium_polylepis.1
MHAQATRRRGARDMAWGMWREGRVLSRGCREPRGAEPGRCRGGVNWGGEWNGPTQTGEKMTPLAFGAHRQDPGTSSMAAVRGAFRCQGPR